MKNKLSHTAWEAQQGRSTTGTIITSQLTQDNLLLLHAFDNNSLALFPGQPWKWSTQSRWLAKQTGRRKSLMALLMVPLPSFCKPSCGFEKTEDFVIRNAYCFRACLPTKDINWDHLTRYIIFKATTMGWQPALLKLLQWGPRNPWMSVSSQSGMFLQNHRTQCLGISENWDTHTEYISQ